MEQGTKFWIVGKYTRVSESSWEFAGLFSTEAKAVDACADEDYFVAPAYLDEQLPLESVEWDGAYYPSERQLTVTG